MHDTCLLIDALQTCLQNLAVGVGAVSNQRAKDFYREYTAFHCFEHCLTKYRNCMEQGICCSLCTVNLEVLLEVVPSYQEKLCMYR